jgi:hypothetical protein
MSECLGSGFEGAVLPRGYEEIKKLAEALRLPVERLLALAPKNDPFYSGAPAQLAKARWFADLWERFRFPAGVHLRRIHYVVASQSPPVPVPDGHPYQNTHRHWGELGDASKATRHLGLVGADAFVDRRNPEPHLVPGRPAGHDGTPACWVDEESWGAWGLPSIPTDFGVEFGLPAVAVSGYDYCPADQPYHVEVWVEKSTMNDVLIPLCRRLGVTLVTGLGFQSITSVVQMLQRIGRPTRILYISDFDPAGDQMPVAVARQVEYYRNQFAAGVDVKLTPLALTREQVRRYDLPRIPIKDTDRRKGDFEDRRGEGAVELDALEALHPGELARLVEEAVRPYRDEALEGRLREAEGAAWRVADEAWQGQLAEPREELERLRRRALEITACYRDALANLSALLRADLAPLREQMEQLRHTVAAIVTRFRDAPPELPRRPAPETGDPEESSWLYASDRAYLEQMAAYRGHKGGKHVKSNERTCAVCGVGFIPRGRQLYCSSGCRMRAFRAKKKKASG